MLLLQPIVETEQDVMTSEAQVIHTETQEIPIEQQVQNLIAQESQVIQQTAPRVSTECHVARLIGGHLGESGALYIRSRPGKLLIHSTSFFRSGFGLNHPAYTLLYLYKRLHMCRKLLCKVYMRRVINDVHVFCFFSLGLSFSILFHLFYCL